MIRRGSSTRRDSFLLRGDADMLGKSCVASEGGGGPRSYCGRRYSRGSRIARCGFVQTSSLDQIDSSPVIIAPVEFGGMRDFQDPGGLRAICKTRWRRGGGSPLHPQALPSSPPSHPGCIRKGADRARVLPHTPLRPAVTLAEVRLQISL